MSGFLKAGLSEKNEETRLDAFEMKGLRRMLRVSWTATKTNVDVILDTLAVYCDI